MSASGGESSETDFWEEFDTLSCLGTESIGNSKGEPTQRTFENLNLETLDTKRSNNLDSNENNKFLKVLEHIRLAKEEEIRSAVIIERKKFEKELKKNSKFWKKQIKTKYEDYENERVRMRNDLVKKENEKKLLLKKIIALENLVTQFRLKDKEISQTPKEEVAQKPVKTEDELKYQLEAYKELTFLYKERADNEALKLKQVTEKCKGKKTKLLEEIETLKKDYDEKLAQAQEEKESVQAEMKKVRESVKYELCIREEINNRQQKFIEALKEELKNVKYVLQSPKLRYKLNSKMSFDEKKTTEAQENSPPSTKRTRLSIKTSFDTKASKQVSRRTVSSKYNRSVDLNSEDSFLSARSINISFPARRKLNQYNK